VSVNWEYGGQKLEFSRRGYGWNQMLDGFAQAGDSVTRLNDSYSTVRFAFYVVNGSGPIATGEMYLEWRVPPVNEWAEVPGIWGKFMQPGYGEFPVSYPPDWAESDLLWFPRAYTGRVIEYRSRVDSLFREGPATHYSDTIAVTVRPNEDVTVLEGFDGHTTNAILFWNEYRVPVVYRAPFRPRKWVEGKSPEILMANEHFDTLGVGHGTEVQVANSDWKVVGVAEHDFDMKRLRLELAS